MITIDRSVEERLVPGRAYFRHMVGMAEQALMQAGGDVIEFGVWKGDTFVELGSLANDYNRRIVGVDSFRGMAPNTERDRMHNGRMGYPQGALACPRGVVEAKLKQYGITNATLYEGFVPEVLVRLPDGPYAYAHVDMDQYQPTMEALEWLWPRMSYHGIIACHDYIPGRTFLAHQAIDDFCERYGAMIACVTNNHHAIIFKRD